MHPAPLRPPEPPAPAPLHITTRAAGLGMCQPQFAAARSGTAASPARRGGHTPPLGIGTQHTAAAAAAQQQLPRLLRRWSGSPPWVPSGAAAAGRPTPLLPLVHQPKDVPLRVPVLRAGPALELPGAALRQLQPLSRTLLCARPSTALPQGSIAALPAEPAGAAAHAGLAPQAAARAVAGPAFAG